MENREFKENALEIEVSFASLHPIVHSFEIGSRCEVEASNQDYIQYSSAIFEIFKRFIPSSLAYMIELGILFMNILFISSLNDPILLSGCGLGFATVNLVVFSINVGLWGGIDTLVSQAYGRRDYYLWGVYLNTSRIILIFLMLMQILLLINCEDIFLFLNQPPESSVIAQAYILSVLPGVFLNSHFECVRRFLLVQGIYYPVLYVIMTSLWIHIISLYIYIVCLEWAIKGIAIATATTYLFNFILIHAYAQWKKDLIPRESWHWFDKNWFIQIPLYLKYGFPAWVMCLAEWWAFECIILMTGWLGINELSATVIMYNWGLILYMLPLGISHTSTSLVGNNLGANRPKIAKTYAQSVIIFLNVK